MLSRYVGDTDSLQGRLLQRETSEQHDASEIQRVGKIVGQVRDFNQKFRPSGDMGDGMEAHRKSRK